MNRKRGQLERGFTLLEVLVAVVIMSIGLLAVASMQANAIRANGFAARVTVITAVAQGALEDLLARSESDPIFDTPVANVVFDLDPNTAATTGTIQGVTYSATYSITPSPIIPPNVTPTSGIAQVVMTVDGGGRTISLTSYKRTI